MSRSVQVGDLLRVRVICWDPNAQQIGLTVRAFYVESFTGTPGLVTTTNAAIWFDTNLGVKYPDVLYNNAMYYGVDVCHLLPNPTDRPESASANRSNGTRGAVGLPTQTAGLISLYTTDRGRTKQGRIYLPFPAAADCITDGLVGAPYQNNAQAIGNYFTNPVTIINGASSVTGEFVAMPIALRLNQFYPFEDALVAGTWATQRRRGGFGPKNLPFV
jgi:hypothetical protein